MEMSLFNAKEELKRAEHLIYVSLKYTRTVDIIKSVIERLIATYEFSLAALIIKNKKEVPKAANPQIAMIRTIYSDNSFIQEIMDQYQLLRKLDKAKFKRSGEFRRNVTMTAIVDEKEIEVNIDLTTEFYKKTVEFMKMIYEDKL